jgi:hypothetical protein
MRLSLKVTHARHLTETLHRCSLPSAGIFVCSVNCSKVRSCLRTEDQTVMCDFPVFNFPVYCRFSCLPITDGLGSPSYGNASLMLTSSVSKPRFSRELFKGAQLRIRRCGILAASPQLLASPCSLTLAEVRLSGPAPRLHPPIRDVEVEKLGLNREPLFSCVSCLSWLC